MYNPDPTSPCSLEAIPSSRLEQNQGQNKNPQTAQPPNRHTRCGKLMRNALALTWSTVDLACTYLCLPTSLYRYMYACASPTRTQNPYHGSAWQVAKITFHFGVPTVQYGPYYLWGTPTPYTLNSMRTLWVPCFRQGRCLRKGPRQPHSPLRGPSERAG